MLIRVLYHQSLSVYETEMLKVSRITGKLLVTLQAMLEASKKLSSVISDEM